ncbi:hypothetical protein FGO68_gene17638 [Halteria grandinella]|uniref:Uncharacterized protein n=1 Tax=Halteria grandinella TaxID=5974 RepID=A0A8J8T820_HALGN|nr:hypothetical protein FGO68_gene17638 [Halteria grandinella]
MSNNPNKSRDNQVYSKLMLHFKTQRLSSQSTENLNKSRNRYQIMPQSANTVGKFNESQESPFLDNSQFTSTRSSVVVQRLKKAFEIDQKRMSCNNDSMVKYESLLLKRRNIPIKSFHQSFTCPLMPLNLNFQ